MSEERVKSSNPYDLAREEAAAEAPQPTDVIRLMLSKLAPRSSAEGTRSWFGGAGSASALSSVTRRMGTALRAGIDLRRILEGEAARGMPGQRAAMETIRRIVSAGGDFSQGVRESGWFPELACDLIEMGEHAGRLDECLLRLADHYDHQIQLRRQFAGAIAWPAIQLALALLIIPVTIWLIGSISEGKMKVLGLAGASGAMIFLTVAGLGLGTIVALIYAVAKGWFGTLPPRVAMKIPVIGTAMEAFAVSRFAWALHSGLEAAMPAKRSVELAFRSAQNPVFSDRATGALADVAAGRELAVALENARVFPRMFLDVFETAEISGTLGTALPRLSTDYEDIGRRNSVITAAAAGFVVWIAVAIFMIFMIFSFAQIYLQPIRDLTDPATQGAGDFSWSE